MTGMIPPTTPPVTPPVTAAFTSPTISCWTRAEATAETTAAIAAIAMTLPHGTRFSLCSTIFHSCPIESSAVPVSLTALALAAAKAAGWGAVLNSLLNLRLTANLLREIPCFGT